MPTNTQDAALDAISAITHKYIIPKLADNINRSNVLLNKIEKDDIPGGVDIRQPVRYARGVQQNYQGSEILNTSYVEKKFSAIYTWKQKNIPIVISGLDEIKNGSGAVQVIKHIQSEVDIAEEDMMDFFGTGLYSSGSDPKEIDGLRLAVSTSNTVGGLSQSSNSWWQAKVDASTTALSLSAMKTTFESAKEGPDAPDLITCDETQFSKFWGLLQPSQRFSDGDTAKAGFKNLLFDGAVVSEDSYCPTGYMYFLNLKHFALVSSTKRKFPGEFVPFDGPVNQDAKIAHIRWAGNLRYAQLRKLGVMSALT